MKVSLFNTPNKPEGTWQFQRGSNTFKNTKHRRSAEQCFEWNKREKKAQQNKDAEHCIYAGFKNQIGPLRRFSQALGHGLAQGQISVGSTVVEAASPAVF